MSRLLLALAVVVLLSTGCTREVLSFSILSNKPVELSKFGELNISQEKVTGEDKVHIIILIPTGIADIGKAVSDTIDQVPGGIALIDGTVTHHHYYIPYIYGQAKYVVEAKVLIDPTIAIANQTSRLVELNDTGEVVKNNELSKAELKSLKVELASSNSHL